MKIILSPKRRKAIKRAQALSLVPPAAYSIPIPARTQARSAEVWGTGR